MVIVHPAGSLVRPHEAVTATATRASADNKIRVGMAVPAQHTIGGAVAMFELILVLSAVAGGAIAGVTGFGIGSLLTPAMAWQVDARLAVAAVSIPHVIGTAFRFWLLGGHVDRQVLLSFGVMSAAGGLTGALVQAEATTPLLMMIFGVLLLFSAAAELTGFGRRMRFEGPVAYVAGALSGLLGGLVGNQGGIRSAALLGVDLPKHAFVATATAVGLMVDGARVPVYVWYMGDAIGSLGAWVALATAGVVAGTVLGHRVLARIPERTFRRTVAVILALLGAAMLGQGVGGTP
jgi:uncharacterized membrane protein YfcA